MNNKSNNLAKYFKYCFILVIFVYLIIIHNQTNSNQVKSPHCFNDITYENTLRLNIILKKFRYLRNFLLILSAGILDISISIVAYSWIVYGKSWRPFMSISLFFLFRELCNFIIEIKEDEDAIWEYPGFPSLSITYHNNREFFFCGSIGLYLICILELMKNKFNKLKWVTIFGINLHFWLLISLRAQYYFSIFCALLAAHYIYIISEKYDYYLNEIYDFNPEETNRKNQLRREAKLKEIIEMSIKNFKSGKETNYNKLPIDNMGNNDNIEMTVDFDNPTDYQENKSEESKSN